MSAVVTTNNDSKKEAAVGGLCHLMEAATALSKLVEASAPRSVSATISSTIAVGQQQSVISDDDESCKKSRASGSNPSSFAAAAAANNQSSSNTNKREIFPQRLVAILSDPTLTEIVTWLPNGKSFVIVRPDVFTEQVLPKYLPPADARGSTKYPSFTRKLNRWGFRQVTRGPDTGAFHHPLFQRDAPHLCLQMVCQRSRDRRSSGKQQQSIAVGPAKLNLPTKKQQQTLAPNRVSAVSLDGQSSTGMASVGSGSSSSSSLTTSHTAQSVSGFLKMAPSASTTANTTGMVGGPATHAVNMAVANLVRVAPATSTAAAGSGAAPGSATAALVQGYAVSKNEALIQEALKQSQEQERLRAAKAMLYHAYLQALGATASSAFHPQPPS